MGIFILFAFFCIAQSAFAQDAEAELLQKQKDLQNECAQIVKSIPCAVGVGDVDKLPAAMNRSERDARHKLAQSVKAFVSYIASDSTWIENGSAQELSKISGKISIDSIGLANSVVLKQEHGIITDEISGKKFYRVLTLMTLNSQLYKEALNETAASAPVAVSGNEAKPSGIEQKLKRIAIKSANILLNLAKRHIGL